MQIEKLQIYSTHHRHQKETMMSEKFLSLNSYPLTPNPLKEEKPLKNNSNDLSFKGFSFGSNTNTNVTTKPEPQKQNKQINGGLILLGTLVVSGLGLRLAPSYKKAISFSEKEFREFTKQHMNEIGTNLLDHLKNSPKAEKQLKIAGDEITIYKKTIPQLIWDGLKYPFAILPGDIANGIVGAIGKIKPLKNFSNNLRQKPFLRNIRQQSKLDSKINALQGLAETMEDFKAKGFDTNKISSEMFQKSFKMFDTQKYGAYDTKHERALNRLVSGLPPAIFLATDAYNLSRMMDDDSEKATKEKKTRFRQEATRIFTSGYITLITLGALTKYVNNSKLGNIIMTAATTLFTESFSRLANGKHIKRLTPEEAREENIRNNAPEKEIKPQVTTFKADIKNNEEDKSQKPLLSFGTLMKASLAVIATGFTLKFARKIKPFDNLIKNFQKPFKDFYKKITTNTKNTIELTEFNKIVNLLEENGYGKLSEKYKEIAKSITNENGIIHLADKDKKIKPLINFFIAPFKFGYNAITLPYRLTQYLISGIKNMKHPKVNTISQAVNKEHDIQVLSRAVENISKKSKKLNTAKADLSLGKITENEYKLAEKQFKDFVEDNILKAFNTITMSNVANSDLSKLAKTAATTATLWFLMTDNYNMVMLKSNGNDVEGAQTKFKERFVQEISRLFYSTLLIDLFNSTFKTQYNSSLLGMSWITLTNTTLSEILTRKSVGVPTSTHTRAELEEIETKQNNATGFLKKYYSFMKRLTGKRSISSYQVKDSNNSNTIPTQINFANNSKVFNSFMSKHPN